MTTALMTGKRSEAKLTQKQAAWDRFFAQALTQFTDPNPNLRHDRALDRTIRALGQRPAAPLTNAELEDLTVQHEVEHLIASSSHRHNYGRNHWGSE